MALRGSKKYNAFETYVSKDGKLHRDLKPECKVLLDTVRDAPYGGKRRKLIYEILKSGAELQVNGKHCVQTKNDPDILRLLKEGKIEMFNEGVSYYGQRVKCKHTFLRIKNG
ncbi:hypothetical protein VWH97_07070 [Escherichia coli O157]|nr:hypothetical protein [Escherichia coli O157]USL83595.1 hypothetical protein A4_519 [Escherichia phage A4]